MKASAENAVGKINLGRRENERRLGRDAICTAKSYGLALERLRISKAVILAPTARLHCLCDRARQWHKRLSWLALLLTPGPYGHALAHFNSALRRKSRRRTRSKARNHSVCIREEHIREDCRDLGKRDAGCREHHRKLLI